MTESNEITMHEICDTDWVSDLQRALLGNQLNLKGTVDRIVKEDYC